MLVYDCNSTPKELGAQIARGGEGAVYPLVTRPELIVKIYHPEKISKHGKDYEKKIEAMINKKADLSNSNVCWPLLSVYNAQKNWIGYAMKKANGVPMMHIAHALAYTKHFPNLDRVGIIKYLLSFLNTVKILHNQQIYVGDYNLHNFLCDPKSDQVTMIDCDSYQLMVAGSLFTCPVGSPDLTPIEHHEKDFRFVVRDVQSELFSIAIIIFQCLMVGRHPYDFKGGDDRVSNMKQEKFAYGIGNKGIPSGPWYNIWSHMPSRVKSMFIEVFGSGIKDKSKRPSIQDWEKELKIYLNEIAKDWHNREIQPSNPKEKNYKGSLSLEQTY